MIIIIIIMILAIIISSSIRMIISISMSIRSISSISTRNTVITTVVGQKLTNQLGHRAGTRLRLQAWRPWKAKTLKALNP